MALFMLDYVTKGFISKTSINKLFTNTKYDDNNKLDTDTLDYILGRANLVCNKPSKDVLDLGYTDLMLFFKNKREKLQLKFFRNIQTTVSKRTTKSKVTNGVQKEEEEEEETYTSKSNYAVAARGSKRSKK